MTPLRRLAAATALAVLLTACAGRDPVPGQPPETAVLRAAWSDPAARLDVDLPGRRASCRIALMVADGRVQLVAMADEGPRLFAASADAVGISATAAAPGLDGAARRLAALAWAAWAAPAGAATCAAGVRRLAGDPLLLRGIGTGAAAVAVGDYRLVGGALLAHRVAGDGLTLRLGRPQTR
ncbi:MAG: hypothetical protein RLZZ127_2610 [Planctomycetota bacterium]|jgi:hypothetical protein